MKVGRIPLVLACVAGLWSAGASAPAHAQPVVDTFFNFTWQRVAQDVCLDRAASAINEAVATFGLDGANTRRDEWFAFADAGDPVLLVFCIADDETDNLVGENAKRVLVSVSVSSTNGPRADEIRTFLVTCMETACPTIMPTTAETITWNTNAARYRGQNGALIDFICPPIAAAGVVGLVWGTDIYTDDSAICHAAAHAGVIEPTAGGPVTIEILPGQGGYIGTFRNGVETQGWQTYAGSFRVVIGG